MFMARKGTRSRPNVKIPKYYHTPYERAKKSIEVPESTIVREPHTDPLMQVEEIKAEPLDLEDDVIEIEDNVVDFSDHELPLHEEEEIIGNYDSPLVNLCDDKNDESKEDDSGSFDKISLLQQPIILDVHSIAEKNPDTLKIVDVDQIKSPAQMEEDKHNDPLATEPILSEPEDNKAMEDPLNLNIANSADDITITNVVTVADTDVAEVVVNTDNSQTDVQMEEIIEEEVVKECDVDIGFQIEKVVSEEVVNDEEVVHELGFHIAKVASEQFAADEEDKGDARDVISENCAGELGFQITNVVSGHFDDADDKVCEEDPRESRDEDPQESRDTELEAVVNDLSEIVGESQMKKVNVPEADVESAAVNDMMSEETRFIAESLEQLLDK